MVGMRNMRSWTALSLAAVLVAACSSQPLDGPETGQSGDAEPGAAAGTRASTIPFGDLRAVTEPAGELTRFRDRASVALTTGSRRELVTPTLAGRNIGDRIFVDLRVPTLSANPEWVGELKVYVNDDTVEGGQRYVGGHSLTNLKPGIAHRLRIPVASDLKPLLRRGTPLRVVLQVPAESPPFFVQQVAVDEIEAKAAASSASVVLKVPSVTSLANTAVSGITSVDIRDHVSISGPAGLTVASLGVTNLGADSITSGNVRSVGNVFMAERARVSGSLTSQTGFSHQSTWTVSGGVNAPQSVSPLVEQTLAVDYPASSLPISLEPNVTASASPGAFTDLVLKTGSKLTLAPGDYYFDSVQIEPSAELRVSNPARAVVIHVKGAITYRGTMPNAEPANVLWMGTGNAAIEIGTPLVGTVLAPGSAVRLAPTNGVAHRGAVFGKSVSVEAGSPLQLVAFSGWNQLVRPVGSADASPTTSFRARWVYPSGEPIQSFSYGPAPSAFRVLAAGQPGEAPTTKLSFQVQNLAAAMGGFKVAYSVVMKSWGLGNFYSDIPLKTASANDTIDPGNTVTVEVPNLPSVLGVKATDMPAKGDIVIGLHKLNGSTVEATPFAYLRMPQFFYHFSDDLTQVFTYSLEAADELLAPPGMKSKAGVVERRAQSVYKANLFAPAGMLNAQTSEQARAALLEAFKDRPAQLYGIAWDAQKTGEAAHSVIPPGATVGGFNDPYIEADGPTGVCAAWPTVFVDGGAEPFPPKSQDEFKNIVDFLPAAYNKAELFTHDGVLIKEGRLNQYGCFDEAQKLGKGNYLLRVSTSGMENNGVRFDITRFEPPESAGADKIVSVTYALFLNAPGHTSTSGSTNFTVTTGMWTESTHLAGFASHLLARDQAGVDFGFTRGSGSAKAYSIKVNTAKISAFDGSALNINAFLTENNWVSDSRWKFVLAHEFGHMIQSFAGVSLPVSYNFKGTSGNTPSRERTDAKDPNSAYDPMNPARAVNCTCDVIEAGDNRLHCLQSVELSSAAQTEAFGHLMASRAWNYAPIDANNDGKCRFTYYKQISATDLGGLSLPPASIDCATPVKHRQVACGGVKIETDATPPVPIEAGSEVDWLTFLRSITSDATTKVTVGDVLAWYKTGCSGDCSDKVVTYSTFLSGVPADKKAFVEGKALEHGVK